MRDAIKNVFLMGIGVASLTKKKAEKTIRVFVRKGAIDNKQAKALVDKVMNEATKVREKLTKEGRNEFNRVKKRIKSSGNNVRRIISKKIDSTTRRIIKKRMKF